ncbi:MAG TPA: hypothetical protein VGF45_06485 [Polyangia bacterium]
MVEPAGTDFSPIEMVPRTGAPILFFPARGSEQLLRDRTAAAQRQLAG